MPFSSQSGKAAIQRIVERLAPKTGLDIGCGAGTYAKLFPNIEWSGVEVWEPYVEKYGLRDLYQQLWVGDAREYEPPATYPTPYVFDLAVAGDVLEHMTSDEAKVLLDKLRAAAKTVIVSIPIGHYPQDEYEGNPFERHIKDDWTDEEVRTVFGEPTWAIVDQEIGVYVWGEMPKLKICVYAVALNEQKFVNRFCEAAQEADLIVVADTGSTDDTVDLLKANGVTVHNISIKPWRFDDARNAALALLPSDIDVCVSLDLDEVLQPGWREEIERVWEQGKTTRLSYLFQWSIANKPFAYDKVHSRHGYRWTRPCHERLWPDRIQEVWSSTDKLLVVHLPDPTKSRGQYLDILRVSVEEMPDDPFNGFYYSRELQFSGRWAEAIDEGKRYLALPKATNINERCYAMRVVGLSYSNLCQFEDALTWYRRACAEAPYTREPWGDLALLCYQMGRWEEAYGATRTMLTITNREAVYTVDEKMWGAFPHDICAIAAWHLGHKDEALRQVDLAIEHEPGNPRLIDNRRLIVGENVAEAAE